jgi:hypothetical protein
MRQGIQRAVIRGVWALALAVACSAPQLTPDQRNANEGGAALAAWEHAHGGAQRRKVAEPSSSDGPSNVDRVIGLRGDERLLGMGSTLVLVGQSCLEQSSRCPNDCVVAQDYRFYTEPSGRVDIVRLRPIVVREPDRRACRRRSCMLRHEPSGELDDLGVHSVAELAIYDVPYTYVLRTCPNTDEP